MADAPFTREDVRRYILQNAMNVPQSDASLASPQYIGPRSSFAPPGVDPLPMRTTDEFSGVNPILASILRYGKGQAGYIGTQALGLPPEALMGPSLAEAGGRTHGLLMEALGMAAQLGPRRPSRVSRASHGSDIEAALTRHAQGATLDADEFNWTVDAPAGKVFRFNGEPSMTIPHTFSMSRGDSRKPEAKRELISMIRLGLEDAPKDEISRNE